jgi:hypothetical protein
MNHIVVIFPVKELLFYFVFIYFIFKMSNAYHCLVHTVLFMEFDGYSFIVKPKVTYVLFPLWTTYTVPQSCWNGRTYML